MAAALQSGDARGVSLATVLSANKDALSVHQSARTQLRQSIFALDASGVAQPGSVTGIDWNPSHDSSTFEVLDRGRNHVLLGANWHYKGTDTANGEVLAVAGHDAATNARHVTFGGNPLAQRGNAAMDAIMRNTVAWLTGKSDLSNLRVVTAHLPGKATYWHQHEVPVRQWLTAQLPGVTINGVPGAQLTTDDTCDGTRLSACLGSADLLVIGREQGPEGPSSGAYPAGYNGQTIMDAVTQAQARGVPVMYLHHYRDANDLASRLLTHFGLRSNSNYWDSAGLRALDPSTQATDPVSANTLALLQRLESNAFTANFSACVTETGKTQCDGDTALQQEFVQPATALRKTLRALDARATAIFDVPGYSLERLLVLLGDKLRETVTYPMDKVTTRDAFFRAYFSDMTAYLNRRHTVAAANQGSFAPAIPATVPAIQRTVTAAAPETGTYEVMTGLYVMPGRTVTLRRVDGHAVSVTVGVNMLRDTTRVYNARGYDRPTLLASPRVTLGAGASLTLTSPFGGPLYLFIQAAAGAPTVQVEVEGVTTHPMLRNLRDAAEVAAFKAELTTTPTNWVGLSTDFLTVHSNVAHMRTTLTAHGRDMNLLADRLWTYLVKDTYELAGFNSSSGEFQLPTSVSSFCTDAGWDCAGSHHRRDTMQHVIADTVAACGAGCSGNPYDQNWALEPLGWGETHEIGHNLQRNRTMIYGGQSGEVSNNIYPIHKQMAFNRAAAPSTPLVARVNSTKAAFDVLLASLQPGASSTHVHTQMWSDTSYAANNSLRLNFYRQLVEFARHHNPRFTDGWELYTLLHLHERNFNLDATNTNWLSARDALGFGTYAARPSTISGNDYMLIVTSRIIGRDMRPVWDLWGVTYSAEAAAQVTAYTLPAASRWLFPMKDLNAFGTGVAAPVELTPSATYPVGF